MPPTPLVAADVLAGKAVEFIEAAEHDDRPFFLYLTPCKGRHLAAQPPAPRAIPRATYTRALREAPRSAWAQ